MRKHTSRILALFLVSCGVLLLSAAETLGGDYSLLYDQVLEKLESLDPGKTIELNMGVEEERYEESFKVTGESLEKLREEKIPADILVKLEGLKGKEFETEEEFTSALEETIGKGQTAQYKPLILKHIDYQGIAVYQYGDTFEMRFQASEDSYIVLMHIAVLEKDSLGNITGGGDITFLLPNCQFPDTKIEGERVYSTLHHFDMNIPAGPPSGFETINLFCSTEKIDLFEADFEKESHYKIKHDDEEQLKKLLDSLDLLEKKEWSGSSLKVRVGSLPVGLKRGMPRKFGALPPIGATGTTGKFFPPIGATGTTGKQ